MDQLTLTTPALLFAAISLLLLTRTMQLLGIGSLLLCVLCMFLVYVDQQLAAEIIFGIALVLLIISLAVSVREIQISVKALDLHIGDMKL